MQAAARSLERITRWRRITPKTLSCSTIAVIPSFAEIRSSNYELNSLNTIR